jgi:transcriptional regulator with XRE-family HTH domain
MSDWSGYDVDRSRKEAGRLFSRKLRESLKEKGVTIYEAARKTGMSYSFMWNMAGSLALPGHDRLKKLCEYFDWKYADIVKHCFPKSGPRKRGRQRIEGNAWPYGRKEVGRIIRDWQKDAGLSDTDLCVKAGITFGYLKSIERGGVNIPPFGTLESIARACRKSPRRLMWWKLVAVTPLEWRDELMKVLLPDAYKDMVGGR